MTFSMTYISSAIRPCTAEELQQLAATSARNNLRDELTGVLLYKDGTFMQVLEGDELAVRKTFARIGGDARHRGVILLLQGDIPQRQFPAWSMRVEIIGGSQSALEPPGEFVKALMAQAQMPEALPPAHTLLMNFAGLSRRTGVGRHQPQ